MTDSSISNNQLVEKIGQSKPRKACLEKGRGEGSQKRKNLRDIELNIV